MRKVYICSPYRAKDSTELDRNIDYAQELTRQALEAGLAPITPHLYMAQCLDEKRAEERALGMTAGLEMLKSCDFVIAGIKYGISESMRKEIETANTLRIEVVNADFLRYWLAYEEWNATVQAVARKERRAEGYARLHCCDFCHGRHFHTCSGYDCREAFNKAYRYAKRTLKNK